MYVHINPDNNTVGAIVPEFDPTFPDIPIERRFAESFVRNCKYYTDKEFESLNIQVGMEYDSSTGTYSFPEVVKGEESGPVNSGTTEDRLAAIEQSILALKQSLDEMDAANAEAIAAIENALCELDM